ncbi:unnamed protein product, partial [Caretta caretta]
MREAPKKFGEPASWNRLLVRGVVAVVGVLVLLYRCGFWKGRGKVFAYCSFRLQEAAGLIPPRSLEVGRIPRNL